MSERFVRSYEQSFSYFFFLILYSSFSRMVEQFYIDVQFGTCSVKVWWYSLKSFNLKRICKKLC